MEDDIAQIVIENFSSQTIEVSKRHLKRFDSGSIRASFSIFVGIRVVRCGNRVRLSMFLKESCLRTVGKDEKAYLLMKSYERKIGWIFRWSSPLIILPPPLNLFRSLRLPIVPVYRSKNTWERRCSDAAQVHKIDPIKMKLTVAQYVAQ